MADKRFKSDASEVIHSAASGLFRAKLIDKKTMREYDELCIEEPPHYEAKDVARIRKSANVSSQSVFAHYLNTSPSTVRQWEAGTKKSSGLAARLLQVVQKHGLEVLA
ncbi:MAG: Antitoxin to RelE-like translational repressor toxin [uncultured Caballeronia sp.]|nr:MAG: Antitoxin to RelE-like translational repressor toxin [uncultured Caballeronia sp.]